MSGPIRTTLSVPAAGLAGSSFRGGGGPGATRRRAVAWGGGGVLAALSAACGGAAPGGEAGKPAISGPKEITWSCYQSGEARQKLWDDSFKMAAAATGVKINVVWEPSQNYWDKRQTEAAAGSGGVDIMINQLNWVVPGGLQGMFPDHYALMRRDKLDTKEFYKADLESWAWKGKLWSMPMQSGGGVFLYNKAMFDAKGVKYPHKDWTTDDLLDAARRLTDAGASKWGLQVGQNGIHYQMGSFMYSFGGKLLNEAKDRAIYADDAGSVRGAEFDVDLTTKHRVTPPPEVLANAPTGQSGMEMNVVAMEFNGLYRHTSVRQAIGAQNLDFAPPPKGPGGAQRVAVAGNAWSILNSSKARDAAWAALHWTYTKEGQQSPLLEAVSWPPVVAAANSPKWLELFKGTRIADVSKVWESGGHDLLVLPEGDKAWTTMNTPMNAALKGELGTREALQESQRQMNELFAQRPANWK